MSNKSYFVYICTNRRNTVFYTGVTNNLVKRIYEHKNRLISGFTSKYNVNKLVYFEIFDDVSTVIEREKKVKKWRRDWKLKLIEFKNPTFSDLYRSIL